MKYKCRNCGRNFDVLGWKKQTSYYYPSNWQYPEGDNTVKIVTFNQYSYTSTTVKKPCCPLCESLEIEEMEKTK